jgi:benzodiazapine receptor
MNIKTKNYLSLMIWILGLILIGSVIGSFTKIEISTWYINLNRSSLTPPNYVFPIAWTILYGMIGASGWFIWKAASFPKLSIIKTLYLIQLILNWSWTPLFFLYHLIGISFVVLIAMDIMVFLIICLAYIKIKTVSLFMFPYLLWLLFASYLNFYIWWYNYGNLALKIFNQ